jgi:hypothetical protein
MTRCWWSYVLIAAACACGGETEGEQISLRWRLAAGAEDRRDFVTDTGWHVTLEEARVSIESVILIGPQADSQGALARVLDLLVPVAHAHGGHDAADGQRVRAELLDPVVLDAGAERARSLGMLPGEAGAVATVKLMLARTSDDADLHGRAAYVRGAAERDGKRITFEGGVTLAKDEPARRVELPVDFSLSDRGSLTVGIEPSEWLRAAELDRLASGDSEQPLEIEPNGQVGRAWAIGLRSPEAFTFTWTPERED